MLAIGCIECGKEFKVSGAEFNERKKDGVPNLCPVCAVLKPVKAIKQAEEAPPEKIKNIDKKFTVIKVDDIKKGRK